MNKEFDNLKSILLLFFCCGVFFCVFNHDVKGKAAKPEKHEYVLSQHSPFIAENYELKVPKLSCSFSNPELNTSNAQDDKTVRPLTVSEKNFLHIKILLKLQSYNRYFASGFHEPSLPA